MVFNLINQELKIYNILKETCGFEHGFILRMKYDEDGILNESNIPETDFTNKFVKGKDNRYIVIGYATKHGGRIKVSARRATINANNKSDYVSIYVANEKNKDVRIEGNPKNIKLKGDELEYYKNLCLRHNNLIQCATDPNMLDYAEKAFIEDEQRYVNKINYKRDRNGNLTIYDKEDKVTAKYNIKGDEI